MLWQHLSCLRTPWKEWTRIKITDLLLFISVSTTHNAQWLIQVLSQIKLKLQKKWQRFLILWTLYVCGLGVEFMAGARLTKFQEHNSHLFVSNFHWWISPRAHSRFFFQLQRKKEWQLVNLSLEETGANLGLRVFWIPHCCLSCLFSNTQPMGASYAGKYVPSINWAVSWSDENCQIQSKVTLSKFGYRSDGVPCVERGYTRRHWARFHWLTEFGTLNIPWEQLLQEAVILCCIVPKLCFWVISLGTWAYQVTKEN